MNENKMNKNEKSCQIELGTLVDFLREELSETEYAEIKSHIASCSSCQTQLDALKADAENIRMTEIEPSTEFHSTLMGRIKEATKELEATKTQHIGPASKRLLKMVARYEDTTAWFRPAWKIGVLAASAAACMLMAFGVHRYMVLPEDATDCLDGGSFTVAKSRERATLGRYRERVNPLAIKDTIATKGKIEFGEFGDFNEGEELIITGLVDTESSERCIMAFRAAEWSEYLESQRNKARGEQEKSRIATLKEESQTIPVINGYITLPKGMLAEYVGSKQLKVLRLANRTEVWVSEQYTAYCETIPNAVIIQTEKPI